MFARPGTPLGDPIEVGALRQALAGPVLSSRTPTAAAKAQPAVLLSNKACFGHTEGAAGMSGLLLAAAAACAQSAAPVRHLRVRNPHVEAALGDWVRQGGRAPHLPRQAGAGGWALGGALGRLAGTSSFGMSGVNAHALVAPGSQMRPALHAQVREGLLDIMILSLCSVSLERTLHMNRLVST